MKLSDDEVVAIALDIGRAWPTVLPTVALEVETLSAANARGIRSLILRDMVQLDGENLTFDGTSRSIVASASSSDGWLAAFIAKDNDPVSLAGEGTFVYPNGTSCVLDFVSPTGIHDLRKTSAVEGIEIVIAVSKNVFDYGILNDPGDAALFVGGSHGHWVKVTKGSIAHGLLSLETAGGSFTQSSVLHTWSSDSLPVDLALAK